MGGPAFVFVGLDVLFLFSCSLDGLACNKLCYVLYARKSSESEDRQIQSIDDQVKYLTNLAKAEGLQIVNVLTEAKSAKQPYGRVKFSEMMDRIEKGDYDAILSWKLDRLLRNSADSGQLQWLVQSGVIKVIRTAEREYTPQTSALLMSVETGMSTQFIQDLSRNTKRGLQSKYFLRRNHRVPRQTVSWKISCHDYRQAKFISDWRDFDDHKTYVH